jgi:hypothetical protein
MIGCYDQAKFEELVGKELIGIEGDKGSEELIFKCRDGSVYKMYHSSDCCETVDIDDICGDLKDLIGTPILVAREDTSQLIPRKDEFADDSFTWTFYNLSTIKGSVTIRWYGSSSGYYSEDVDFVKTKKEDE